MIKSPLLALAAALFAFPSAAVAGEVFGGVYKHNVDTPLSLGEGLEGGIDFQLGFRGGNIIPGTKLQPHIFGALNSKGETNYAAAGLSWKFGDRYYVRPGVGIAIHDGATDKFDRADRIAFGSRVLAELELGIGARISERSSIEGSWVHMSHAQAFGGQNPGIDNFGARFNFKL
jgi:hypothetical protein